MRRRNRLSTSVFSVLATLGVLSGLLIPSSAQQDPVPPPPRCDLYPIALYTGSLEHVQPGDVVADILNGTQPGNFGWLTWNGDLAAPTLARSLTPPGDAGRYVNPDNPADHDVSVGDRILGRPGAVNTLAVRKALNLLETLDARVPVWDNTAVTGSNTTYRVSAFASVRLLEYRINGNARITVRFLGFDECGAPEERPPVATEGAAETPEDTPEELALDASDPNGDPLGFSVVSGPAHGSLGPVVGNRVTYTPAPDFHGQDSFTFKANDGTADSNVATFRLTVTPVNDQPVAHDATAGTAEDTSKQLTLSAEDPDGDPLTFSITSGPAHGTLGPLTGGTVLYTPSKDYNGADAFSFRASDGTDQSQSATLALTITEVNDQPSSGSDEFAVGVTESTEIPVAAVLKNDVPGPANEAGQALEVTAVSETPNTHGAVEVGNGKITYTPDPGFGGTATVGYTVCDQGTTTGRPDPRCASDGLVTLEVTPSDRPPTANSQQLATDEDVALPITLTGNDPDTDPLTFRVADPPAHGSLVGTAPALSYVPAAHYNGPDEFSFTASDGPLRSDPATVTINVHEVNDPPVLGDDAATLGGAGELPPVPPRPSCPLPCGVIYGDPHLSSFDAALYDFQAVGEFIAAESTTDDFEVQARLAPVPPLLTVSIATAVAMRVAGHRVGFYRTLTGTTTRVDGVPFTVTPHPQALPGGGLIGTYGSSNEIFVVWPDRSVAIVAAVGLFPQYYRFTVQLGLSAARRTHFVGLLGNADGQVANDIVTRDGQSIPYPDPPFNQLYPGYANSWRISQAESLFDYAPGETTETFTDPTFPHAPATPATLPPAVRAAAATQCGLFGVTVPQILDACTVDVGLTSDPEFASSSAAAQQVAFAIPDNTGPIVIGERTTLNIDAAGQNAVRTFSGTAGQKLTLTVSENSIAGVDLILRRPDGVNVAARFDLRDADWWSDAFTLPVTGTYTLLIDPRLQNLGSLKALLAPVPLNEGVIPIGERAIVTIGTAGENAVRTFSGNAGQKLTLTVSENSIAGVDLILRQPGGSNATAVFNLRDADWWSDAFTLPVTGTYTLLIDPRLQNLGSLKALLAPVPLNEGVIPIGERAIVTIGTAGENAVRTFSGSAGQKLTLTVSENSIAGVDLIVRQPGGVNGAARFDLRDADWWSDAFTLPVTGTYTLLIDPRLQNLGSLKALLAPVPLNEGVIPIGERAIVTIGTAGENAVRTFSGSAGQKLTLTVSENSIAGVDLIVGRPGGGTVASIFNLTAANRFVDTFELPVTGTYTVTVDPREQKLGSLTVLLAPVPDNTGVSVIGQLTTVTIGTIGENAVRSFTATAGQRVTLAVSGNTIPSVNLTIRTPANGLLGALSVSGPSAFRPGMTLPVTGTYTITIDPTEQNTGRLDFILNEVTGDVELQPSLLALQAGRRAWAREETTPATAPATTGAAAAAPPVLELPVAQVLANDHPGPPNESDQTLTVTAVQTDANSHGTASLANGIITYTPDSAYVGPATFTYTACDDGTTRGQPDPLCSDAAIGVKVAANHPPTAMSQQVSTQEEVAQAIVLAGSDEDGDPLGFQIVEAPSHGTLTGAAHNLIYTPAPEFHGPDSFIYATNDGKDESARATVGITVTEVNDPPSPQPDSITGGVGKSVSVAATTMRANDVPGPFDERGQRLTVTAVTATPDTHGTARLDDGAVTYDPDAGFTGTAKVLYTACDDGTTNGQPDPRCAEGELSIVANLAPTATAQSASTLRNTAVTITLAGSDPENDVLTFAVSSPPAHGALRGTGDSRVYTPDTGFTGSDSFGFTAADAYSQSAPATASIDVAATPPPIIRPDAAATAVNTSVLIDVLANDTAPAGGLDPATLAVVVPPTNGTATVEGSAIRYTPAAGVTPDDRFTYQVCDTFGVCGQAEVTVSAVVPNRPPVAKVDSYQVDIAATLDVAAPGLLANDSDPDPGDRIQARIGTGSSAGSLLLRFDGSFRYTPSPGFAGLDSFTYYVEDRAGLTSSPVTVTIDVVPPGPLAVDDTYATTSDNPLTVMPAGVLANDRDPHSTDILTAKLTREPSRGTVSLNADGSFVYIPDPGVVGTDSFRYVATDVPGLVSPEAFVTINVTAPSCPLPTVDHVTPADGSKVTAPAAVTANVVPPPGETVDEWKVTARNQDRGTPIVLGSGTGAPPTRLATFDPTTLVNGSYQILVATKASGGCATTAVSNVFVTGEMKLGDYRTTYLDLETTIAGFPVRVLRTYDTTDKRRGDFGIGWRVELSGFRATTNNRLGQGGWSTEPFGFPFTRFRFKTSVPHFVTVTSPGGRTEVFDFVPAPSGPLLSLTTPQFVPRPGTGTTSELEDADPPTLSLAGTSLADFFGGTIYDPRLFRMTTKDGYVLIIDRFGGLKSVTDRNGNKFDISADGVHSDSTDRHLTFVRDGAGRITEIRGPAGKRTQYTYSAAGDLRTFVAANGGLDTFSYDGSHRLLAVDGPGGTRLRTLTYGPDGRLASLTDATSNTINLSSEVDDRSEIFTSPSGRLTTLSTYGADGYVITEEEVFSGHSRVTRYEYDSEGRRTRTIAPLGRIETLTYDAAGNVTSRTTPKNEMWSYAYSALNRPTTTTAPDGTVSESFSYDARGNLTSATFRDGSAVAYTNDSRGLPVTATDSFGTTSFAYDANQQLTAETNPAGGVMRRTYDDGGRLSSIENPAGEVTRLAWNTSDQLVALTAPDGSKQAASYDEFGRLITRTDSAGRVTTYGYDAASRIDTHVDRAGQTTTYSYDHDGNRKAVLYADGDVATTVWDPVGRLISVSDEDTIVEYTYNDADDLLSERTRGNNGVALPDVTLSYTTDPNGQRTSASGPGGNVQYGYDSRSRLTSVRDGAGRTFSLTYDNTDRLTGLARPNNVNDILTYREYSLTGRNAFRGADLVGRAEYTLDALGRRTSLIDLDGTHTFSHNLANRLTGASHPAASGLVSESYAYDSVGNRTSWDGSPPATVSYDAGMQLRSDGTYDYTYDAEGRVTERRNRATGGVTRYRWNSAAQLTSVTAPGGATSSYRYDALGRRVEVDDDGAARRLVYTGWNLRNEFDETNALRATYVTGLGLNTLFEILRDGVSYYPLFDGVGSIRALTDDTGAVVGQTRYSTFGVPHASGIADNGFTFTGHQYDEATGLVYARARYYDPTIGRFLSQDPEPAVNPYPYASNDPTSRVDVTGRSDSAEYGKTQENVAMRAQKVESPRPPSPNSPQMECHNTVLLLINNFFRSGGNITTRSDIVFVFTLADDICGRPSVP